MIMRLPAISPDEMREIESIIGRIIERRAPVVVSFVWWFRVTESGQPMTLYPIKRAKTEQIPAGRAARDVVGDETSAAAWDRCCIDRGSPAGVRWKVFK
jgi:hypothetical protein